MGASARVSVVIATYNRAHLLAEALESVQAQTFCDLEIVVVDDGSSDDTPEVLRGRGDRIRVIRFGSNRGISAARNAGVNAARGELVAFIDSDDAWYPEKLAWQVAAFDTDPRLDCLTAGMDTGPRVTRHRACRRDGERAPLRVGVSDVVGHRSGWMSTFVIRRERALMLGPFDEGLRLCEDKDYFLRAARHLNFERRFEVLGSYRCHAGNSSAWSREVALHDVIVFERWSCADLPRDEAAALRRGLAMARYHLARFEMCADDRQLAAARLFVTAALADPVVATRAAGSRGGVVARALELSRPWVAALSCATRAMSGRLVQRGRA